MISLPLPRGEDEKPSERKCFLGLVAAKQLHALWTMVFGPYHQPISEGLHQYDLPKCRLKSQHLTASLPPFLFQFRDPLSIQKPIISIIVIYLNWGI